MDRRISSVIIITTLLSLSLGGLFFLGPEVAGALPTHPTILIDGNTNFTAGNGVTSGNGTASDPYIIDNYNISALTNNSIEIRNTDAHFIIRNMSLHSGKIVTNYGIYLYNVTNVVIENVTSVNNYYGIWLSYSTKVTIKSSRLTSNRDGVYITNSPFVNITNCNISSNSYNGLHVSSSDNINIIGNEILNNLNYGMYLDSSDYNTILDNNVTNSISLMYLLSSHYNKIFSNNIRQCDFYGIYLTSSLHNNISLNSITNTMYGVHPWFSSYTTVWNNNISSNSFAAVSMSHSSNNVVTKNTCLSNGGYGIHTAGVTDSNIISHNEVTDTNYGIHFETPSINNVITYNRLVGNYYGLNMDEDTNNNEIKHNDIIKNTYGVHIGASNNNDVISNFFVDNEFGISLEGSTNIRVKDNTIENSNITDIMLVDTISTLMTDNILTGKGLVIEGDNLSHWNTHTIGTTNTLNNMPINYWKDRTSGAVPAGVGQVILANCSSIFIDGLDISNIAVGIELGFSSGNTIVNNTVSENDRYGILLSNSDDNVVFGNSAEMNLEAGIYIDNSQGNRIYSNNLADNGDGISLDNSNSNIIKSNQVTSNTVGLHMVQSTSNQVVQNVFTINQNQSIIVESGTNTLNSDYPTCGNYWSDYNGVDQFNGPDQDIPGSDGIGDTPYLINSNNLDIFPYMYPHDDVLPEVVLNLQASPGDSFINLEWNQPVQAGQFPVFKYELFRNSSSGEMVYYQEIWNLSSFNDTAVINGIGYTYKVRALNLIGSGPFSAEVTDAPRTVPAAPEGLKATAGISTMILTWSAPGSDGGSVITGYKIYRGNETSNLTFLTGLGLVLSYSDIGVLEGTTYYYQVSAVNALGESMRSFEVSAHTPSVPTSPQNILAEVVRGNITLTWDRPVSDGGIPITGYRLYKSTGLIEQVSMIELDNVLTYTDSNVTKGNKYTYEISAVNEIGEGALSAGVIVVLPTIPGVPANFTIIAGDSYILLNWKVPETDGSSAVRTYNIYRSTVANESFTIIKARKVIFYNDTDVINGVTYYYRVSAVNDVGEGASTGILNGTPSLLHNQVPTAEPGADRTSGNAPLTVKFTGSGSDADGNVVSYIWDFGDNNMTYTKDPVHTFELEGTYTVKFTVIDDSGGSTTVKLTITVLPAGSASGKDSDDKAEDSSNIFTAGIAALAGIVVLIILVLLWLKVFRFRNVVKSNQTPPESKPDEIEKSKEVSEPSHSKPVPKQKDKDEVVNEPGKKVEEPRKPFQPEQASEPEDDPFAVKDVSVFGFERDGE